MESNSKIIVTSLVTITLAIGFVSIAYMQSAHALFNTSNSNFGQIINNNRPSTSGFQLPQGTSPINGAHGSSAHQSSTGDCPTATTLHEVPNKAGQKIGIAKGGQTIRDFAAC